ncbi:hypothetical protein [uncultured Maricaulis sp.]|uniref:hypothetical protein n=1 Tax=uncultured Maricaulis sp. TaxID=174710 RepID=UPI0030DA410F|tara:strand:+ start:11637 stop:12503 length:867 start_codon:yes stop_codon:yes gene_type:complete
MGTAAESGNRAGQKAGAKKSRVPAHGTPARAPTKSARVVKKSPQVALREARELVTLQDLALRDILPKWERAERERGEYARALMLVRGTTVYRYGGIARFLGRRLPRPGQWVSRVLDAGYATITLRLGRWINERRHAAARFEEDRATILLSGLFDSEWYVSAYPDAASYKGGPLEHFLRHGAQDGRNPNSVFSTSWYLAAYPEVAGSGRNPLAHYQLYGVPLGYQPSYKFDANWYARKHASLIKDGISPLQHYLKYGHQQGLATQLLDDVEQSRRLAPKAGKTESGAGG